MQVFHKFFPFLFHMGKLSQQNISIVLHYLGLPNYFQQCILLPSLPLVNNAHTLSCQHNRKENVFFSLQPSFKESSCISESWVLMTLLLVYLFSFFSSLLGKIHNNHYFGNASSPVVQPSEADQEKWAHLPFSLVCKLFPGWT